MKPESKGNSRAVGWRKDKRIHEFVAQLVELSTACISSAGFMHRSGVHSLARRVDYPMNEQLTHF